jgi:osmotically-inducible protein OsmY
MTNGLQANTNMNATRTNPANSHFVFRDQAITPGDRTLLTTLRQGVAAQLGVTALRALPVHFMINNGAVTLVGTVPTADDSQRIFARVQETPGVLSVFNDLRVGNNAQNPVQPRNNLAGGAGITDHAFTPADRTLLTVVEQAVGNQLGVNGASTAQMPVHFSVQEGVVGVTGQLSSPQEKAAILAAVKQTPGVVRVVDNVALVNVPQNGSFVPNPVPQNPAMNNQPLPPTSRSMGLTNSLFLNSTNQNQ